MGSLASERNVLEEGLNLIKNAKLEFASPVSEMYLAIQKQYTQVRTIKLQGKAQDYVKKVLHDSKFFCILTKLITQAVTQSKNNKQQTANLSRVHKWYTSNLHKLHFAEQPAFRRNEDTENQERTTLSRQSNRNSYGSARSSRGNSAPVSRPTSKKSNSPVSQDGNDRTDRVEKVIRASSSRLSRPKSVTWRESHEEKQIVEDETGSEEKAEELWDTETEVKSDTGDVTTPPRTNTPVVTSAIDSAVHSVSDRRTPDYHLVDDNSYIDNITSANQMTPRNNSPVSRPFTPVVYDYIEQIQREVNKVQGHPSDLYPELFTPHIVNAIIGENEELRPMPKALAEDKGRNLREKSIEQFFSMTESYRPNNVKKFSSLAPRRDRKPRPKSSLALLSNSRPRTPKPESKSVQMKDVVGLADFASAEISYEKESGLRAVLNRPKDKPPSLPPQQLAIEPPPSSPGSSPGRTTIQSLPAPIESNSNPSTSMHSIVDWRGTVTPSCNESQQEMFKSHSYARRSARLSAQGRAVGGTSAGFRPKTAPVSHHSDSRKSSDKVLPGTERVPQAASNTLVQMDKSTTKALLNITNIKGSAIRKEHKEAGSVELFGKEYLDYLTSRYAVPPSSVYEFDSYPYEHEPLPKTYTFMEEDERGDDDPPSPRAREYLTIVQSIAPDIERLRQKSKRDIRVERAGTPASSVKTREEPELTNLMITAEDCTDPQADGDKEESANQPAALDASVHSGGAGDAPNSSPTTNEGKSQQQQQLVQSPLFHFSAYPTPSGGVLRAHSPPGRARTVTTKDNHPSERPLTAISFNPPFDTEHFERPTKPRSAGKLAASIDKSQNLVQPLRSAPSIPSMHGTYGCRSPRLSRNHPFSGEHDRSAHRHLNPQEYINKVNSMRALDVITDGEDNSDQGEITSALSVRPMSSTRDLHPVHSDLSVYNAIKFDRPRIPSPPEDHPHHPSPTFMTESGTWDSRPRSGRPKSSLSRPDSSRPIPQYMKAEHWEKIDADTERQREAAAAVSIQKIFRGYVNRKAYLNLKKEYREEQENKRISAVTIQRSWRQHQSRLKTIYSKPTVKAETLQWAMEFKQSQIKSRGVRETKRAAENKTIKKLDKQSKEKLSVIGPHVEVYSAYHQPKYGYTKKEVNRAATKIQKVVRGRQCRAYLDMVKQKAKWHASSWSEWVKYYKQFLRSILIRRGVEKPSIEINLEQMQKFMAQKKRYEGVFNRRSFGGELEEDEFVAFFKECDLMPAQHEIEHAMDLVFHGKPRGKRTTLKKREVLDMVFEIYKPEGTGLTNDRKSTWLHPIVEGEDAMKLLGSDMVEPAPLGPCLQLVAASMKERRERAEEEERLQILADTASSRRQETASYISAEDNKSVNSESTMKAKSGTASDLGGSGDNLPVPQIFSNEPLYSPKQ